MRKFAAKVDENQAEIVMLLKDPRSLGASVQQLHSVGGGLPDLLLGIQQVNFLLEVKMPGGVFTPAQRTWHSGWQGQARTATSALEAVVALRLYAEELQQYANLILQDCERAERFIRGYNGQ